MPKHRKYAAVKYLLEKGKLKVFSDLFKKGRLPKSVVAADLGKEKGRFNQLIKKPNGFNYQEIRKFSEYCEITPPEMGTLIENEHPWIPAEDAKQEENDYGIMKQMIEKKEINSLMEAIDYFGRSEIARKIGRKSTTLDRYLKNVDLFPIEDLRAIGGLFGMTLPDMLKLVGAYTKNKNTSLYKSSDP
jgi:hypothetical protein